MESLLSRSLTTCNSLPPTRSLCFFAPHSLLAHPRLASPDSLTRLSRPPLASGSHPARIARLAHTAFSPPTRFWLTPARIARLAHTAPSLPARSSLSPGSHRPTRSHGAIALRSLLSLPRLTSPDSLTASDRALHSLLYRMGGGFLSNLGGFSINTRIYAYLHCI